MPGEDGRPHGFVESYAPDYTIAACVFAIPTAAVTYAKALQSDWETPLENFRVC